MLRLLCLAVLCCTLLGLAPALAQTSADPGTAVWRWGEAAVQIVDWLSKGLLPALITAATTAILRVYPWMRLVLTQARVEQMTAAVGDYAIAATAGAVKDKTIPLHLGSAVIAEFVERALDAAPKALIKHVGGERGLAELAFRSLKLAPEATVENTLEPALSMQFLRGDRHG